MCQNAQKQKGKKMRIDERNVELLAKSIVLLAKSIVLLAKSIVLLLVSYRSLFTQKNFFLIVFHHHVYELLEVNFTIAVRV